MQCPRCGHRYICGCSNCKTNNRGKIVWKWTSGETEACGICGLEASADQWFDEQFWQLSERTQDAFEHPIATLVGYRFRPGKQPIRLPNRPQN